MPSVRYLGHSSFYISSTKGTSIVTDPFGKTMPYTFPMVSADIILQSHEHADHNAYWRVGGNPLVLKRTSDYIVELTQRLTEQGIPVLAHLGFTPQFLNALGGYKVQAKGAEQTEFILGQALKLQKAGAFGVVLEMVSAEAAKYITSHLDIPTIGIGAGKDTDGQILVVDDVLGKYKDFEPKFVKKYADLCEEMGNALKSYISDVKSGEFPDEQHTFKMSEDEREKLEYASSN